MRFFEAQEKAWMQTLRLLLLFGLAVVALVLSVNGQALRSGGYSQSLAGQP